MQNTIGSIATVTRKKILILGALLSLVGFGLATFSAAGKEAESAAFAPGTLTVKIFGQWTPTPTDTFSFRHQIFTGSTTCTSGGGTITTVNGVNAVGVPISVGVGNSVLISASTNSDRNGVLQGYQNPDGLTTIPVPGNKVCVEGFDNMTKNLPTQYSPGAETLAFDTGLNACTNTPKYMFDVGEKVCARVSGTGGTPGTPWKAKISGGGPNSCFNFFPETSVTSETQSVTYTLPATNAGIPPVCSGNPTTEIRGNWDIRLDDQGNNFRGGRQFRVHNPGSPLTSLNVSSSLAGDQTYPTASGAGSPAALIRYSTSINNNGPDPAASVSLVMSVPAGITYISTVQTSGIPFACAGPTGGNVTCTIPTMQPNSFASFEMTVSYVNKAAGTNFTSNATATTSTAELNVVDNAGTSTATVVSATNIGQYFCRSDITVNSTSAAGAVVNYSPSTPTTTLPYTSGFFAPSPPNNSLFPIGTNFVTYVGTNSGSCSFKVIVVDGQNPDLTISKSHAIDFVQGQVGAQYTLSVKNIGALPTTGTVTVTEAPPSGMTVTGMTGTGWTCNVGTYSCTRNNALAPDASYEPITVTVNVSSYLINQGNGETTNRATVSGGGDMTPPAVFPATNNNEASDLTQVAPLGTALGEPAPQVCMAGNLDDTFITTDGVGTVPAGVSRVTFPFGSPSTTSQDFARFAGLQSDGKIVVAGMGQFSGQSQIALARLNTNGTIDGTFGGGAPGGKVIVPLPAPAVPPAPPNQFNYHRNPNIVKAVMSGDKVVILSNVTYGDANGGGPGPCFTGMSSSTDFLITVVNADGTLDTNFDGDPGIGNGNGQVRLDMRGCTDGPTGIAVQTDGKIVVVGTATNNDATDTDIVFFRLNTNGTLDTTYDTDGKVFFNLPTVPDLGISDIAIIQGAGADQNKVVMLGTKQQGGGFGDFQLNRLNTDGTIDMSFGPANAGFVTTHFGAAGQSSSGVKLVLYPDGRILAAGSTSPVGGAEWAVARYDSDGALDTAGFDADGKQTVGGFVLPPPPPGGTPCTNLDPPALLGVDGSGNVIMGSHTNCGGNQAAVARLTSAGALDSGFGTGGKVATTLGQNAGVDNSVNPSGGLVQADGKIVLAGQINTSFVSDSDMFAARFCSGAPAGPVIDAGITKTDGSATAVPGSTTTYTITATNVGGVAINPATVADTFPAAITSVTWTCAGSGGATCAAGGSGNINDATVNLPIGGSVTYTAIATISPVAIGNLANTATVTAAGDANGGNNSATDTDTLTPQANLSITKTDSPDPITPGNNILYTITAGNAGPSNAATVTMSDTVPANTTFVSLPNPAGWTCVTPAVGGTGAINCVNPSVVSGGSTVFSLTVNVAAATVAGTIISNTATVSSSTTDPTPGNNSATATTTVSPPPTSTSVTSSANPSVFGQPVTFTATVSTVPPGGSPTGNVNFLDGATPIAGCQNRPLNGSSQATCVTATLSVGSHTITANYLGNSSFLPSSGNIVQVVNKANTTTSVTASPASPSIFGQSVTFTATVAAAPPGAGTPTGTVTFNIDGNLYCVNTPLNGSQQASCTQAGLPALGAGVRNVVAIYNGDGNFNGSAGTLNYTVNKANTTTAIVTDLPDPSLVNQPYTVTWTVTAVAPGAGTPTGTVTVNGGTGGGSCTAPATNGGCQLTPTTIGVKTIQATFNGDANFNGSASATTTHTVNVGIMGTVRNGITNAPVAGETMFLSCASPASIPTVTTNAAGQYSFSGQFVGPCGLFPNSFYSEPFQRNYAIVTTNITGADFLIWANAGEFPRKMTHPTQFVAPGDAGTMPVILNSLDNEATLGYSITYDINPFQQAPVFVCGANAPGCTITNNTTVFGKVGVTITPAGGVFTRPDGTPLDRTEAAGPKEIARINFLTAITTTLPSTDFVVGNNPVGAGAFDAGGNNLLVVFNTPVRVVFAQGKEGDVAGRNAGSGTFEAADVVQMRRFVTGLDTPVTTHNEYQRADVAPATAKGDGNLNATDVVQVRRYVAGLDAPQNAGGSGLANPTARIAPPETGETDRSNPVSEITIGDAQATNKTRVSVPVTMRATGSEIAANFTVRYDETRLAEPNVTLGVGAPEGAVLTFGEMEPGILRILVDSSNAFTKSADARLVDITFELLESSPSGETELEIEDLVFSNVNAEALHARATSGKISISGPNLSEQRGTRRRPKLDLVEEYLGNGLVILRPRQTNDPTQPRIITRRLQVPR